jgi:FkbM family methyltransferase
LSLRAAAVGKARVIAFEPQPQVAELLGRSVGLNRLDGVVRIEACALSNVESRMKMTACPGNSGHSQLRNADAADGHSLEVPVVVLDNWLEANPGGPVSVCKIDTEGSEIQVLEGMARLLDRDGPAIVVEVIDEFLAEYGGSAARLLEFLERHGYVEISAAYTFHKDPNRYFAKKPAGDRGQGR